MLIRDFGRNLCSDCCLFITALLLNCTCSFILNFSNKGTSGRSDNTRQVINQHQVCAPLTDKVQFKAFAGVVGVADELQPHGAGGGVQGGVEQLAAREHTQQARLVAAAVKHLAGAREIWDVSVPTRRSKKAPPPFLTFSRSSSASLKSRARSWMPLPGCVWME